MSTEKPTVGLAVVDPQALTQALYAELAQWQAKALGQRTFIAVAKTANVPAQYLAEAAKLADVYEETGARLFAAVDRIVAAARGQRSASEAAAVPTPSAWPNAAAAAAATTAENSKLKPQDRYVAVVSLVEALSKLGNVSKDVAQRAQRLYDDVSKLCPSMGDVADSVEKVRIEWPGAGGIEALQRDECLKRTSELCSTAVGNRLSVITAPLKSAELLTSNDYYVSNIEVILQTLSSLPYPGGVVQAQAEATIAELRRLRNDAFVVTKLRRLVEEAK